MREAPGSTERLPTLTEVVEWPAHGPLAAASPTSPPGTTPDDERGPHAASPWASDETVKALALAPERPPLGSTDVDLDADAGAGAGADADADADADAENDNDSLTTPVAAPPAPKPAEASALPSTEALAERVLADVQRQIDLMLDYRLREALTPMLTRMADNLVREARSELASTLRDVVTRVVAQELSRHRSD